MARIKVSVATYNEIATALELTGQNLNSGANLVIEKGTTLECPMDFRLATIRRDCLIEAVKLLSSKGSYMGSEVIQVASDMYNFVTNTKPETGE